MDDLSTIVIALASGITGSIFTYFGALRLANRENRQNVNGLRKLIYEDIITMYVELIKAGIASHKAFQADKILNQNDVQTIRGESAGIASFSHSFLQIMSDDWYMRARAEPSLFMQLYSSERQAMRQINLVQKAFSGKIFGLITEIDREQLVKSKDDLKFLNNLQADILVQTLDFIRKSIKSGLNKKLLLEVCPDKDRWWIKKTLARDEKASSEPKDASSEKPAEKPKNPFNK